MAMPHSEFGVHPELCTLTSFNTKGLGSSEYPRISQSVPYFLLYLKICISRLYLDSCYPSGPANTLAIRINTR